MSSMRSLVTLARRITVAALPLTLGACKDSFVPNYNDPSIDPSITSAAQLQPLATGLVTGDREQHAFQILIQETMGRDALRLDAADPRYVSNPLQGFDASAFITNFLWLSHYRTIRGAIELSRSVDASPLSAQEKAATKGFARTIQALEYIRLVEMRDTLGLPINTGGGEVAAIRCKPIVLAYISSLLDSAATDLAAGGAAFPFSLPSGFRSNGTFDTPPTFLKFNRALKAKNEMYRGFISYAKNQTVDATALNAGLAALDASFYGTAVPFRDGVYHVYSTASGDLTNSNFDQSVYRANPKVLSEADAGDRRLSKVNQVPSSTRTTQGVTSDILFTNISGPTTPLPIVINEELILVRAEVLWGLGRDAEALALSNQVRTTSGGLTAITPANHLALLREILKQKRYSLLYESPSRFIDIRMFGLLSDLGPKESAQFTDTFPLAVPFPQTEQDARSGQLSCS